MTDRQNPDPVGYRMPPRKHRFKKGQSGNPAGRPLKSQNKRSILERVLGEKVRLSGRPERSRKWFSWFELIVMMLKSLVADGSLPAAKLYDEVEHKLNEPKPEIIYTLVIPERLNEEEWEALYTPKDPPVDEADYLDDDDGWVSIPASQNQNSNKRGTYYR